MINDLISNKVQLYNDFSDFKVLTIQEEFFTCNIYKNYEIILFLEGIKNDNNYFE